MICLPVLNECMSSLTYVCVHMHVWCMYSVLHMYFYVFVLYGNICVWYMYAYDAGMYVVCIYVWCMHICCVCLCMMCMYVLCMFEYYI